MLDLPVGPAGLIPAHYDEIPRVGADLTNFGACSFHEFVQWLMGVDRVEDDTGLELVWEGVSHGVEEDTALFVDNLSALRDSCLVLVIDLFGDVHGFGNATIAAVDQQDRSCDSRVSRQS